MIPTSRMERFGELCELSQQGPAQNYPESTYLLIQEA